MKGKVGIYSNKRIRVTDEYGRYWWELPDKLIQEVDYEFDEDGNITPNIEVVLPKCKKVWLVMPACHPVALIRAMNNKTKLQTYIDLIACNAKLLGG